MATLNATQPAPPHADMKIRIAEAVEAARSEILELSHRIHAHPEPAFEEHHAARWVAEAVGRYGYTVEHPAGSLATAVRATRCGGQPGDGPRIGILAEYDALPGLGHGCGHNTMAASGVGAAIALTLIPVLWLTVFGRQGQIAYRGDWLRAIRRGAWVGIVVAVLIVLRVQGLLELPIALFMIALAVVAEATLSAER